MYFDLHSCNAKLVRLIPIFLLSGLCWGQVPQPPANKLAIHGDVAKPLSLSLTELNSLPRFQLSRVALLQEKKNSSDPEKLLSVANYRGILLRDLLEQAEILHTRKWEPSVFVRVRGGDGKEDVFSFGEIFYSSIGRSILLATEKDGSPLSPAEGVGQLIVSTDLRGGRWMTGVKDIQVERVNVQLKAYDDLAKDVVRPPTASLSFKDSRGSSQLRLADLRALPAVHIPAAVMVGDCEGMRGVFSFKGARLRDVLALRGAAWNPAMAGHYAFICSDDGFCATFSFGELFNSRLDNNIVIAYEKDGKLLGPDDGFARSVTAEDSTGGRSVRRISYVEVR
jgi:DMSO/TMAO reductase YedYZ molybdopterin-dependent catalytic subunit